MCVFVGIVYVRCGGAPWQMGRHGVPERADGQDKGHGVEASVSNARWPSDPLCVGVCVCVIGKS